MGPWINWWPSLAAWAREFVRGIALFSLAVYRVNLSGFFGGTCRFDPSCSVYAEQAFARHAPARAFWLTVLRLLKCHPLGPFGPDPVPERKSS